MTGEQLIIFGIVVTAAAAFLQGAMGFGYGIAAMALLTGIGGLTPAAASVLVTIGGLGPLVLMVARLGRSIQWRQAGLLMVGLGLGVPAGVVVLARADPLLLRRALGLFVIVFSAWSLLRPTMRQRPDRPWSALGVGLVSGVLGGAFCAPGPTLVAYIYSKPWSRDTVKSTINVCFLGMSLVRLVSLRWEGLVTSELLTVSWWCLAASSVGVLIGLRMVTVLSSERFRQVAWLTLGLLGILLVVRG